jgi:hypothetical protein
VQWRSKGKSIENTYPKAGHTLGWEKINSVRGCEAMELEYHDERVEIYRGKYGEYVIYLLWRRIRHFIQIPAKYVPVAVSYLTERFKGTKFWKPIERYVIPYFKAQRWHQQ